MADYEQLVLFDLAPWTSQQTTVKEKALGFKKREPLKQIEGKQLELDLFPQYTDRIFDKSMRLAA